MRRRALAALGALRLKLLSAFVTALLVLVVGLVALWIVNATSGNHERVERAVDVRRRLRLLRLALMEAESGERGYLLTSRPRYLAPYFDARQQVFEELDGLGGALAGDPVQQPLLLPLRALVHGRLVELAVTIGLHDHRGPEAARAVVDSDAGDGLMLAIRDLLHTMEGREDEAIERLNRWLARDTALSRWVIGVGSALGFALTAVIQAVILRDVMARARATAIIARQATELERQNAEIRQGNAALARSNRDLDQLAYVASHDLKAPLRGISSLAEWVEEDLGGRLDERNREHLRLLRIRVHRMVGLIDGILTYSRAGKKRGRTTMVEVGALVRDVLARLSVPLSTQIHVDRILPTLATDRVALQQVWESLIDNAARHGGCDQAALHLGGCPDGEGWQFWVRDNGPGIEPRYHGRIFKMFQTLAPRDQAPGAGIGLAVARKLVEARGGRIWVESVPGEGASFHFTWKEPTT